MTRLLIATDNYPPRWDGISRFLSEVIPRLDDFHPTVICPDYGEHEVDNAEHIKLATTDMTFGDYQFAHPEFSLIKDQVKQSDIVFGQSIGTIGSVAGHYARKTNTPLTHYTHTIEWQLVPKATEQNLLKRLSQAMTRKYAKWYYNRCDKLVTPSRNISETLHYEGIQTKTYVAPLGVNHEAFKPRADHEETRLIESIRRKYLDEEDHTLIGYHGRLAREKDLMTLLRAVKRLRKRRDDFSVLIIGDGLQSIRSTFEQDPACHTLPAQENVEDYVAAFDIFVTSTLTETTSLSTAEAMACGNAVIATPAGYIKDYIDHADNGLLFDKQDNYMLSEYLSTLLDDPEERQRLGSNAHETATDIFQWEKTATKIQAILNDYA